MVKDRKAKSSFHNHIHRRILGQVSAGSLGSLYSLIMSPLLLTAHDCTGHIHLIIGSNSIANARCTKSIEVGAKPLVIASPETEMHYALKDRIDAGQIKWIRRNFKDDDLTSLGRDEVENVVDAVFVTLGGKEFLRTSWH